MGAVVLVMLMVLIGAGLLWTVGVGGGSERGYADTVMRYADRSYEGASWQVVRETSSLGSLGAGSQRNDKVKLARIFGYDEDNLWVIDIKGPVFRLQEGHWKYVFTIPNRNSNEMPHGRIIDRDTLLVGGDWSTQVHRINGQGVRSFDLYAGHSPRSVNSEPLRPGDAIVPFAPGIIYLATGSRYTGTSHKITGDDIDLLDPAKGHQESVIVDDNGNPIRVNKNYYVNSPTLRDLWLAITPSEGEVLGVARINQRGVEPMLVTYRSGTWCRLDDITLPGPYNYSTGWLSRDEQGKAFCVFVGKGQAVVYRQDQGTTTHPINVATAVTGLDLINVWGESPTHFWVMDRTGSVWEFRDGEWRQLIRGMLEDDVVFTDSWVSHDGVVFALTQDTLYKLD